MAGVVVDQLLFRFSIFRPVPEIFTIKVLGCLKLRRTLHVFCPFKFLWSGCPQICTQIFIPPSRHITWTSLARLFLLTQSYQSKCTQFWTNFLISVVKKVLGPLFWYHVRWEGVTILLHVKIKGAAPFRGENMIFGRSWFWVGQHARL